MIDHISTYALDFQRTRSFYLPVLDTLGFGVASEFVAEWEIEFPTRRVIGLGPGERGEFWIIETREAYTPRHFAFRARSTLQVDLFHAVALDQGGVDNGAPGPRPEYHAGYYGAFVIDPDGNNVEAVCHSES